MSQIRLKEISLPEFGIPDERPEIEPKIYAERLHRLGTLSRQAGLDILVLYADREHFANVAYLTGFDPRFEEALLILVQGREPVILTGPENVGWSDRSGAINIKMMLYPTFGLLGQDRRGTPALADLLRANGISADSTVGALGWKYFSKLETSTPDIWLDIPSYVGDALRDIVGKKGKVVNATGLLMDSTRGMRAVNEVDQIAEFEFAACQTSESVKRALFNVRPGMREFEAAQLMRPIGLPLSCHLMFSSGKRANFGLNSPSDKIVERGDPYSIAIGMWGALNCRAGWLVEDAGELPEPIADYLERLAIPYFACVAEWYETIGVGISGGTIDALVKKHLGDPFFGLQLNPGHLIHLDEWLNSPVYPGSEEHFASGQAIQADIIVATGSAYFTIKAEDGIALLDDRDRAIFAERFPAAWRRVEHRRAFMADVIGISLKPEVLPLCNIPAYLPPFALSPKQVLVRH